MPPEEDESDPYFWKVCARCTEFTGKKVFRDDLVINYSQYWCKDEDACAGRCILLTKRNRKAAPQD